MSQIMYNIHKDICKDIKGFIYDIMRISASIWFVKININVQIDRTFFCCLACSPQKTATDDDLLIQQYTLYFSLDYI